MVMAHDEVAARWDPIPFWCLPSCKSPEGNVCFLYKECDIRNDWEGM
jgi:hypothetical protein